MAILLAIAGLSRTARALPGDLTWQDITASGSLPSGWQNWQVATSSADGTKLAVSNIPGGSVSNYFYSTQDGGTTWVNQAGNSTPWLAMATSADGNKLVAAPTGGYISTSQNGGATWTEHTDGPNSFFYSIASSSDGSKIIAAESTASGHLYQSTDYGSTWSQLTAAGARRWNAVASSADGTRLIAGVDTGYLYTSSDSGASWTKQTTPGSSSSVWYAVASSADGMKLAAVDDNNTVYTSDDGGTSWNTRIIPGATYLERIASSADGTKLIAGDYTQHVYISKDSGATWAEHTPSGMDSGIVAVASSANGSKLVVVTGDAVYIGNVEGAATTKLGLSALASGANAARAKEIHDATVSVTSDTCYSFDNASIATLPGNGVTAPDSKYSIIGGITYSLHCVTSGGTAQVEIALNGLYRDLQALRIYKSASGALQDITQQVTLLNTPINGTTRTTISYQLEDGGIFDEDSTADGTIVDPIYIGVALGSTTSGGTLVNTGEAALPSSILAVILGCIAVLTRAGFKQHKYTIR